LAAARTQAIVVSASAVTLPILPFVPKLPGTRWMESVPLCDDDKAKIPSGNAKRLFRM
jgi:hypothetical protein